MVKCAVLVVAAGRGHRFGEDLPKQYNMLGKRPVLRHCLAEFVANPNINYVRTVIHPDDRILYETAAKSLNVLPPVNGGKTRQDSVRLGLESLKEYNPDIVLIHDGARPFVNSDVINNVLIALEESKAVIPAIAVCDTLKKADINKTITDTVDRSHLYRAQTPQGFDFKTIMSAHEKAKGLELTDDAAVIENFGLKVKICQGAENNIKITTKQDLFNSEKSLQNGGEILVGSGFDVHQLIEGNEITLCGIKIPHNKTLKGHSDADVVLHAITDAILGAISAGDIGAHFPPSDNKWKGASSDIFLKYARELVEAKGGYINNIDVTVMCEEPKIGKYRLRMMQKVSEILELSQSKISIKATTTEKLGFTGRSEGIAASAIATVKI
jgi:2-C-methyl-D-erythritol 4-phosphate cytidylyltransferase/2-C-methyl-D-erythritol 2,4-cyclodiphosphate synthase